VSSGDNRQSFRTRLAVIIFESDTPLGKLFDVLLLWTILLSVLFVLLESVAGVRDLHGGTLQGFEFVFTGLFTVEYLARLYSARRALHYARSFYGIVDLLSILPGYLSLLVPGAQYLLVIRALRLLRVFRVLKLSRYLGEASVLSTALKASRFKITVFLYTVLMIVLIIGSVMYLVEGPENGFLNIPVSIYWAIVTLTTVGYGDISPQTPLGQLIAALLMIVGYGIIAVPTGIVTVELNRAARAQGGRVCPECHLTSHDTDARYCKRCGTPLQV
jgi:voltage-gated potassium channel